MSENNKPPPFQVAVKNWCNVNHWTDPMYVESEGMWFAYPPGEANREPVPWFVNLCKQHLGRDYN